MLLTLKLGSSTPELKIAVIVGVEAIGLTDAKNASSFVNLATQYSAV